MSNGKRGRMARVGAAILWLVVIFLWAQYELWQVFAFLLAGHFLEAVTFGLKKGKAAGYSSVESFLYTLIFGFTWWKFLDIKPNKTSHV